jgi:hypothetical protein
VDQEQERKKGWGLASPLATGGGVDIAGSVGGGFGRSLAPASVCPHRPNGAL